MKKEDDIIYTLCWFDEEQWKLLSKIDPTGVDESYSEWKKNANKAYSELIENGLKAQKISIKISKLQEWCLERGVESNSKSRSEYAAYLAQERYEKT
ncbi:MAG: hypothetical protein AAES65_03080 [Candidatus Thiodiazotropha sp. (ex. Lucinoma kazani)]